MPLNNHPSMEELIEFAELNTNTLDKGKLTRYFSVACHIAECEECRKIKNELLEYNLAVSDALDTHEYNKKRTAVIEARERQQELEHKKRVRGISREKVTFIKSR